MAEKFLQLNITSRGKLLNVSGKTIALQSGIKKALGNKGILRKDELKIAQLIRDKISSNIARGKRYDTGGAVKGLAQSTIKRKGFSKPLVETGKMLLGVIYKVEGGKVVVRMKNDKYASKKSKKGKVIKGKRPTVAEVASYNQKTRPFFGINKKDLTQFANEVLGARVKKALR